MRLALGQGVGSRRLEASFTIPAGCGAPRLELAGSPGEFPKTTEFSIGDLEIKRFPGA
jgi:hypothetical protein